MEAALAEDAEVSVLNSIRCGNGKKKVGDCFHCAKSSAEFEYTLGLGGHQTRLKKKAFLSQLRRNVVFLKLDLVSFGISSCSNRRKIPAVTRACLCLPGERKNKNACSCRLVEAALAEDAQFSVSFEFDPLWKRHCSAFDLSSAVQNICFIYLHLFISSCAGYSLLLLVAFVLEFLALILLI